MHVYFEEVCSELTQRFKFDVTFEAILPVRFGFTMRVVHLQKCARNDEFQKNTHNVRIYLTIGSFAHLVHYNK